MKPLLFAILAAALLSPVSSWAAVANAIISYSPDPSWQVAEGGSFLDLPVNSVTSSRRLAIRFFANRVKVGEVWDDPTSREWTISIDLGLSPVSHLSAQAVAYEGGPWKASTAFSAGAKLSIGAYPSPHFFMEATTAGTSGITEPEWPEKHPFPAARSTTLAAGRCSSPWYTTQTACAANSGTWTPVAAVDNGNGTVTLPFVGTIWKTENSTNYFKPAYYQTERITISGTTNYDGTYTLGSQTLAGVNEVLITATYIAESFDGTEAIAIADSSAVDNGNGTVNLPCPKHELTPGQDVTIAGTTNYNGTYTLGTQSDPDFLTITATYVAEQMGGGYAIDKTVSDGSVVWTFTDASTPLAVLESDVSRRIVGRVNAGLLGRSGVKFNAVNAQ